MVRRSRRRSSAGGTVSRGAGGREIAVGALIQSATIGALVAAFAPSAAAADDAELARGKQLFSGGAQPSCTVCHALQDAGATGAVGPSLDDLKPDATRVATALKSGIGAMPSFRATLSDADIQALAKYVAKASGGAP